MVQGLGRLFDPVCAPLVGISCHEGMSSILSDSLKNFLITGSDINIIHGRGEAGSPTHMLDHRQIQYLG